MYKHIMAHMTKIEKRVMRHVADNGISESIPVIAKRLRIKPTTLNYLIRKFESKGWIRGYAYRLNPLAFGYSYPFWFFIKARHHKNISILDDMILEFSEVYVTNRITGPYDIAFLAFFKGQYDSAAFVDKLIESTSTYVRRVYSYPVLSLEKLHNIELKRKTSVNIDKKSISIIKYISFNPTASISKIAEDLGYHRDTVSKRIKWMKDEQVILKRSVILDKKIANKIGMAVRSIIFMNVEPSTRKRSLELAKKEDFVHEMFLLGSRFDSLLVTRAHSVDDLYTNISKLFSRDIAVTTESSVVFYFREKESPACFLNGF